MGSLALGMALQLHCVLNLVSSVVVAALLCCLVVAHTCTLISQDYYELGVILTRKKLFTQATKNLEKAKKLWDGEESDLAQVMAFGRMGVS